MFTVVASSRPAAAVCWRPDGSCAVRDPLFSAAASGPTAIATIFEANLGTTLLYGFIITIPTVIVAGPLFSKLLTRF